MTKHFPGSTNNHRSWTHACLAAAAVMAWACSANAAAPKWLACSGEVTVSAGGQQTTEKAEDIYAYDDDGKSLFRFSVPNKALSYIGTSTYTPAEIKWSGGSGGSGVSASTSWEGTINRTSMTLQITYKSGGETRIWNQQCKPTEPRK